MSPWLPRVTSAEVWSVLERMVFVEVRQSGSHRIYRNADGKRATVPVHARVIFHAKLLSSILRDAGLTVEELEAAL